MKHGEVRMVPSLQPAPGGDVSDSSWNAHQVAQPYVKAGGEALSRQFSPSKGLLGIKVWEQSFS